ncbi:MAG: hypothetical protein GMKNLPBB_01452 [Myxococcota bacterium]|nr:hypothetical protein [Myxococcota bacterium]
MKTTTIRRAGAGDISLVADFNQKLALETEGKKLDTARVTAGVRAVLDDPSRGFYLIAQQEGGPVGQLMVTFEWSDWRNGVFWWIQSVYVDAEHRRTGVYRALHEQVLRLAREAGDVCGVRLYVDKQNLTGQRAYESLGMTQAHYHIYEIDFVLGAHTGHRGGKDD